MRVFDLMGVRPPTAELNRFIKNVRFMSGKLMKISDSAKTGFLACSLFI
jgi:hypothetical protein